MAENEPIAPQLIHFRFPVTREFMEDMTKIVAEMNLEHDRQMSALWTKTVRYRRQRNTLAITIGVIAWQSYRNYKAEMKKPLDRD